MLGRRSRSQGWGDAGLMLVALALLVRLLLPAGFMLSTDRTSLPTLEMCTAQGAVMMSIDAEGRVQAIDDQGHTDDDSKSDRPSHPCTFAATGAAVVAPQLIAVITPMPLVRVAASLLPSTQRPGLGLAAPPPPTTGPPARL